MQAVTQDGRSPQPTNQDAGSFVVHTQDLIDALKVMGLEGLDPDQIAPEFQDDLVRVAKTWKASLATTTLASRRCDLRRFARWCEGRRMNPFATAHLLSELMEAHVVEVGQTLSASTTQRVGSSLSALAKGLGSDRASRGAKERRRLAVRAAQKVRNQPGSQHQKPRLTVPQMQSIRVSIEAGDALPHRRLRDIAIFDIMCDLLARRSEVVGMRLRDLDLSAGAVRISYSKTDQSGRGALFQISPRTVTSIATWLDASGLWDLDTDDAGALPLFVGIMNDGEIRLGPDDVPTAMDGKSIARILQRYAEPLGIAGVSGHSLRRSMARALHEAGVPEDEIVKKGRWSSLDQMREYVGLTAPIKGASDLIF